MCSSDLFNGGGTSVRLLIWITVIAMAAYLAWLRRRPGRDAAAAVLALLLILLIFSKGVSSYYSFWLFPLIFVVYRPVLACAISLAFLLVGNIEAAAAHLRAMLQFEAFWMAIWGRHALFVGLLAHVMSTRFQSASRTVVDRGSRPRAGELFEA